MAKSVLNGWECSIRQSFCLLPKKRSEWGWLMLGSDGAEVSDIMAKWPYNEERSRGSEKKDGPDEKRYRDARLVLILTGLLYEQQIDEKRIVRLTNFGRAVRRWGERDLVDENSLPIVAPYIVRGLAACQLRNPTENGAKFGKDYNVFPFLFMLRAMLELDGRISSDELNRAIFWTKNERDLEQSIEKIQRYRHGDKDALGAPVATGEATNDRIIPWVAMASLGWLLVKDKRESGSDYYELKAGAFDAVRSAVSESQAHIDFGDSIENYVRYISESSGLPGDPQ